MDTILVVDDDPHIREVLRFALGKAGYTTVEASDGCEAIAKFKQVAPDLVVLDVVMPEMDGTQVCREIRQDSVTPIIFLSSRDEEIDRVLGLELGGDDYVTKPFSPREVVARVGAILRRLKQPAAKTSGSASLPALQHGNLRIDSDGFKAYWGELEITLTVTEFNILSTLARRPGKVFTRDELMEGAYEDSRYVSDRTIDSHVRRIRKKFMARGGDPIETRRGVGYILTACD
tara:strand:- start:239 stop:934 length:696 start_codon:yes stop_codon:yes gene_type:complete